MPRITCQNFAMVEIQVGKELLDYRNPTIHSEDSSVFPNLCSTNVIVFYLAYLALAGLMNLLAQSSDRIIHFGEYNLMPLAFLTKLSIMH